MHDLLVLAFGALLGAVGILLRSYLSETGRNIATNEDIATITREVWEILIAVHRAAAGLRPVWDRGLAQGNSWTVIRCACAAPVSWINSPPTGPTHAPPKISRDGGSARSYTWQSQASGMSDLPWHASQTPQSPPVI